MTKFAGTWKWKKGDLVDHMFTDPHPYNRPTNLPSEAKLRRSTWDVLHGWHCQQHMMPGYQRHEIVAHGFDDRHHNEEILI